MFDSTQCLGEKNVKSDFCDGCKINGGERDVLHCPFNCAKPIYYEYSTKELLIELERDIDLFKRSVGGVTFSGGEPLLQSPNLINLLRLLQGHGVDICFETTLVAPNKNIMDILPFASKFIVDIKLQPEMLLYNQEYLDNLSNILNNIRDKTNLGFRLVFVDSISSCEDCVITKITQLGISEIELIKAHNLAKAKYSKLNLNSKDFTPSQQELKLFAGKLSHCGIKTSILSV